ncbi:hypothetical protein [Limisphaera sp. VF-2]|uniref:hypothetical protein n=1 Tax=Limisphaera sp. VF-2 TaxID=3400418 RepID=UPI002568A3CB|nr:hypothetical protein [Limisphaera sp.]
MSEAGAVPIARKAQAMAKAEISWKRRAPDGTRLQVYAHLVGGEWRFYIRSRRYERWMPVKDPPLEDWLALLDAVRRLVPRRRYQPEDEAHLRQRIRERFPEVDL